MNRLLRSTILFFLIWGSSSTLFAQHYSTREQRLDDPVIFGHNALSFNLAELMQYGFEFCYERKVVDKQWLSIAPTYYGYSSFTDGIATALHMLRGAGIRLEHKYYPWHDTRFKQALFLSYGVQYQYFDVSSKNRIETIIHRYSMNCQIGYRKIIGKVFFFEVFAGLGTSFVQRKDSFHGLDAEVADYTTFFGGYARRGPQLRLGLSMGVVI